MRQSDRERRTMSLRRRHVDPPPVCSRDPLDDVEPKSKVTSVASDRAAPAQLKPLEIGFERVGDDMRGGVRAPVPISVAANLTRYSRRRKREYRSRPFRRASIGADSRVKSRVGERVHVHPIRGRRRLSCDESRNSLTEQRLSPVLALELAARPSSLRAVQTQLRPFPDVPVSVCRMR